MSLEKKTNVNDRSFHLLAHQALALTLITQAVTWIFYHVLGTKYQGI